MKANHNLERSWLTNDLTVSCGSKILKWKQITTCNLLVNLFSNCFLWFKDTKMKANHNPLLILLFFVLTVSCGSKILKWKQITTWKLSITSFNDCFLWFKDTKMKANHNRSLVSRKSYWTVSCGSKILKWKQITTSMTATNTFRWLFPVVQRY